MEISLVKTGKKIKQEQVKGAYFQTTRFMTKNLGTRLYKIRCTEMTLECVNRPILNFTGTNSLLRQIPIKIVMIYRKFGQQHFLKVNKFLTERLS